MQQSRGTPRILIVDADAQLHGAAVAILQRAGVDVDYANDLSAAAARLVEQQYAAVWIDAVTTACDSSILGTLVPPSGPRPVVVLAADEAARSFDPALVSLIIRKPYDVQMVIGVLLACGTSPSPPDIIQ